jgi:VanZ like family
MLPVNDFEPNGRRTRSDLRIASVFQADGPGDSTGQPRTLRDVVPVWARRAAPWLPVLAWMVLIFSFSSLREPRFSSVPTDDLVIKKVGHFCLYLVLAVTLAFALDRSLVGTAWSARAVRLAFIVSVAFAASDELHQAFTPTRDPSPIDVGIDSLGALTGIVLFTAAMRWWAGRRVRTR